MSRHDAYGRRFSRSHSRGLAYTTPIISIMIGSIIPVFFIVSAFPLCPPLGFITLMAWRVVRPGLLPVWIGFPLGLFDDLFSGQPFGSGIFLWSVTLIVMDLLDLRLPWRSFVQDWMITSLVIALYIVGMLLLSGGTLGTPVLIALIPQFILSVLIFPILSRFVSRLDRFRLKRIYKI